jgi:hypothetical protein
MNILTDIDEGELLASLENSINAADSYSESNIGEQRDKGYRYYYGQPLGNERTGRSQHVSMDVFDAVESVKSLLMETFSADRNVCKFDPQTAEDVLAAKSATALANFIFYRENKGTKVLHITSMTRRRLKVLMRPALTPSPQTRTSLSPNMLKSSQPQLFKIRKPDRSLRCNRQCIAVRSFAKLINLRCVLKISHPKTF